MIPLDKDENGLVSLASQLGSANLLPSIADVTDGAQVKKALAEDPCVVPWGASLAMIERALRELSHVFTEI